MWLHYNHLETVDINRHSEEVVDSGNGTNRIPAGKLRMCVLRLIENVFDSGIIQ